MEKFKIVLLILVLVLYGKFIIYDGSKYIDNKEYKNANNK